MRFSIKPVSTIREALGSIHSTIRKSKGVYRNYLVLKIVLQVGEEAQQVKTLTTPSDNMSLVSGILRVGENQCLQTAFWSPLELRGILPYTF